MRELRIGDPGDLATDVGPLIDQTAMTKLDGLHRSLRAPANVATVALPALCGATDRHFVAPHDHRDRRRSDLEREMFGPVLHVAALRADELDGPSTRSNAGFGLTMGLHSRIDAVAARGRHAGRRQHLHQPLDHRRGRRHPAVRRRRPVGHRPEGRRSAAASPRRPSTARGANAGGDDRGTELPEPAGETDTWRVEPRGRLVAVGGGDNSEAIWRAQADAALATAGQPRDLRARRCRLHRRAPRGLGALVQKTHIDVVSPNADWSALTDIDGVLAADPEEPSQAEANRARGHREAPAWR